MILNEISLNYKNKFSINQKLLESIVDMALDEYFSDMRLEKTSDEVKNKIKEMRSFRGN